MRRETVRCSRPDDLIAPRTVPTTAQQMPTKAIMTMNQRIDTVCVTVTPQHDLPPSTSPAYIEARDLLNNNNNMNIMKHNIISTTE